VVLELDFGDNAAHARQHHISILLHDDTPHAAWVWLEQIRNQVWDGAEFQWKQRHIIETFPPRDDRWDLERDNRHIEFVEHSKQAAVHTAWTVGLHNNQQEPANENTAKGSGNGNGAMMSMYINLQNNSDSQLQKNETCVGKIVDGFDALQKLLEWSRISQETSFSSPPITIRKATAEQHGKKKAGMGK